MHDRTRSWIDRATDVCLVLLVILAAVFGLRDEYARAAYMMAIVILFRLESRHA